MNTCIKCRRPMFKLSEEGICGPCHRLRNYPKGCKYCRNYIAQSRLYCNDECLAADTKLALRKLGLEVTSGK